MLDNIRRKFSYSNVKVFYNSACDLGRFEDLIYYKGVGSALPYKRCTQKKSNKSFRYIYKTSKTVKLRNTKINMIACPSSIRQKYSYENLEGLFLLGETEVTQELYQAVMGTNPSQYQNDSQNPVEQVSWGEAILFCNALSKLQGLDECYILRDISTIYEGYGEEDEDEESYKYEVTCDFSKNGYRLPTEKEWEYAAKAGTNNKWAGTDNVNALVHYAVYYGNSKIDGDEQPHRVKSKLPNEWGLYDMTGNVFEWCWDKYDPDNPKPSADRVMRGGGWNVDASTSRSDYRNYDSPSSRTGSLGFRVCRSIVN